MKWFRGWPQAIATQFALGLGGWLLLASCALAAPSPPNAAAKPGRFALVIGNADYTVAKRRLKNPVNDAKLIAQSLRKLDFEVTQYANLDRGGMMRAVSAFI